MTHGRTSSSSSSSSAWQSPTASAVPVEPRSTLGDLARRTGSLPAEEPSTVPSATPAADGLAHRGQALQSRLYLAAPRTARTMEEPSSGPVRGGAATEANGTRARHLFSHPRPASLLQRTAEPAVGLPLARALAAWRISGARRWSHGGRTDRLAAMDDAPAAAEPRPRWQGTAALYVVPTLSTRTTPP